MKTAQTLMRQGYAVLMVVSALFILAIISLAQAVSRDLELLESANSDNVQWTLSQTEVEFLDFERALDKGLIESEFDAETIRLEFDIFYSRVSTLENGALYQGLRDTADFQTELTVVRQFLDQHAPLIDRLETASQAEFLTLAQSAEQIAGHVRRLANSGLYFFASQSDTRRASIAVSLQRLAIVTTSLIAALGLLAYYSHRMGRHAQHSKLELQSAYARMNTVVNTSLDAVIVSDSKGRILDFNAAAEKIFGRKFKDVHGQALGDIIVPPHLRDAHDAGVKRFENAGKPHVIGHGRVQLEGMRANGEIFPVELALETAGVGDERLVIGFLRDISAQVAAAEELVAARDRALAGEKAKADFLAVMTHEIRTPLNGVLGNLSLLEDTRLTNKQARYAHNMNISARQLMQHVDTVLDIARFESGLITSVETPTHLGHLMQDIVDGQSGAAEAQGNTLSWSWIGPQATWVQTDTARLQQVLLNLVGNAIKFTQDGRIDIEAEQLSSGPEIEVEFRIIDTGIGISEADQDRIFEDFQTVDASFQRAAGGTGLGLGIVRRLVQTMGGTLGVESEPGDGSVFWIRLRFDRAEAPKDGATDADQPAQQRPLEILAVEDNEINLQLLQERLKIMGHHVTSAQNGLEGVQAATAHRFDLVLMDISMPVMDGLEACRQIRAGQGPSSRSPIVALSANVLPEMRDRIVAAGMSGFLGKPLQQNELVTLLAEAGHGAVPISEGPAPSVLDGLRQRFETEVETLMKWLDPLPADRSQIAANCHKVAGSAAAFDNLALRDALVQVEQAAQTDTPDAELIQLITAARDLWRGA